MFIGRGGRGTLPCAEAAEVLVYVYIDMSHICKYYNIVLTRKLLGKHNIPIKHNYSCNWSGLSMSWVAIIHPSASSKIGGAVSLNQVVVVSWFKLH